MQMWKPEEFIFIMQMTCRIMQMMKGTAYVMTQYTDVM